MKKIIIAILFFFVWEIATTKEVDWVSIPKKAKNFKFGVHLGGNASQIGFGKSGLFEISEDAKLGGSFGFRLDWRISDYNRIWVEPYYYLQQFENRFEQEGFIIQSEFQNHGVGMDVFPVVLQIGGIVKPTISLSGFINYLVASQSESQINENSLDYEFTDIEKIQGGFVA